MVHRVFERSLAVAGQLSDIATWQDAHVTEERIAAAISAGGTLVSDRRARAFWILTDANGNEACICTW